MPSYLLFTLSVVKVGRASLTVGAKHMRVG